MSDGLTDGYRAARRHEERQATIDAYFRSLTTMAEGGRVHPDEFRAAFDAYDALRYEGHIARGRIEKEREKRWAAVRAGSRLMANSRKSLEDRHLRVVWADQIAQALLHASPAAAEALRAVSPYKDSRVALYVPNGTSHDGYRREPSVLGDFAGALDALAEGGTAISVKLFDRERTVVGLKGSAGSYEEVVEQERGMLRFLAVSARRRA